MLYFTAIIMLTALLKLLTACLPPLMRPRCTRFSTHSHPFSVHPPFARVNQYLNSFFVSTGELWNSLPLCLFPASYFQLNQFQERSILEQESRGKYFRTRNTIATKFNSCQLNTLPALWQQQSFPLPRHSSQRSPTSTTGAITSRRGTCLLYGSRTLMLQ